MPRLTLFICLLLCGLFSFQLSAQIKLVSENGNAPVPYAHIFLDNVYYTYSNEKGEFELDNKQMFDTLKIVHLSYETKLVSYNDLKQPAVITLKEKATTLDEVVITATLKTSKKQILLPEKSYKEFIGKDHDIPLVVETGNIYGEDPDAIKVARAVYIPNDSKTENALVTKIILKSVDKQIEGDKPYMPFMVSLMTYDTVTHLPKDKIFAEDLHVGKKSGQEVIIDLSKQEPVVFPKEGICVVVSVYRTEHYIHNGCSGPPKFDTVALKKSSGYREYFCYGSHAWAEQSYSQRREQCFNFGIAVE